MPQLPQDIRAVLPAAMKFWVYLTLYSATVCSTNLCATTAIAGDWPQILGPHRNGIAVDEVLGDWGVSGPTHMWRHRVTSGFAGIAVSQGKAILFERDDDLEIVRCHNAANGQRLWSSTAPCTYKGGISSDNGPRCVPLIHGDFVYVVGVEGLIRCVKLLDGKEVWQRDTRKDFAPAEGYFGVGSTPVIYENLLIVNVGSREDAAVVAFDITDGRTIWKTFADNASYSAPVVTTIGDTVHVLVVTRLHLISIDPANGAVRFELPFGSRGPTVNGATPVVIGNRFLLTSSYGIGAVFSEIEGTQAKQIWKDYEILASQYATPIAMDNLVFAVDGRQDSGSGSASVKCIDLPSQKVLWSQDGFDYGTMIRAGKDLLLLTCGGELIRIEATPERYHEIARAGVLERTDSGYRLPALANGRLYIRDDTTLKCLNVGLNVR
jgi:outer membrane protein assembly factor BamB